MAKASLLIELPMINTTTFNISFASLFKIVLVAVGIYFVYQILDIIALLFVAVILSIALTPWVNILEKNKIPRSLAVFGMYLCLFLIISVIVALMVPPLVLQITDLSHNLPFYYNKLLLGFSNIGGNFTDEISNSLSNALQSLGSNLTQTTSSLLGAVATIFGGLAQFVIMLVITYYLIVESSGLKRFVRSLTPTRHHDFLTQITHRLQEKLGAWLRGQLLLMFIIGICTYVGLLLLDVFGLSSLGARYALVLALWAGLTELVPYVGPVLGAIPAVFLALAVSPVQGLSVLVLYVAIQQLENNFIVPSVMRRAVGLNPIISIVAVMVGAKIWGLTGAIMAIPVATAVAVVLSDFFDEKINSNNSTPTPESINY